MYEGGLWICTASELRHEGIVVGRHLNRKGKGERGAVGCCWPLLLLLQVLSLPPPLLLVLLRLLLLVVSFPLRLLL